nr:YitT family protein [Clostridia bacterium]
MTKQQIFKEIKGYFFMLLGCVMYGGGTSLFLQPNAIVAGGFSGLAVSINLLFNKIPVGTLIIVMNIPVLICGLRMQGWKFIVRSLITIVSLGIITDLIVKIPSITSDRILASLYGGIGQGIGLGFCLRYEFSSGGTELLGRIISRLIRVVRIPICVGILDGIIVVWGAIVTKDPNNMLYALIVIFVSTKLSEWILVGGEKSKLCIIITDKGKEVSDTLLKNSPRGVTMLSGEGMYTHKDRDVLLTCVKKRQLNQLKQLVYNVDTHAFIIVNDSVEVRGKGFQALEEGLKKQAIEEAVEAEEK